MRQGQAVGAGHVRNLFHIYGWRRNEPLENMRVVCLDFSERTISLLDSKNNDGRVVAMTQKVFELLKACCNGKGKSDFAFPRADGSPVKDFRSAWKRITTRTATGKPDSVFRRYNIIDQNDIRDAMSKLEANSKLEVQSARNENSPQTAHIYAGCRCAFT